MPMKDSAFLHLSSHSPSAMSLQSLSQSRFSENAWPSLVLCRHHDIDVIKVYGPPGPHPELSNAASADTASGFVPSRALCPSASLPLDRENRYTVKATWFVCFPIDPIRLLHDVSLLAFDCCSRFDVNDNRCRIGGNGIRK